MMTRQARAMQEGEKIGIVVLVNLYSATIISRWKW